MKDADVAKKGGGIYKAGSDESGMKNMNQKIIRGVGHET